jgi:4-hydroxybenzoyl-CoA reductase alpha subunit
MEVNAKTYHVIGKNLPRVDAVDKVTGRAEYLPDLIRPHMLYGHILRSTIPHGRIVNIDTSRAEQLPGVKAVIIAQDIPDTLFGFQMGMANKSPLARNKVRYVGDEIAAVAATSEEVAQEACALIECEIQPLPAIFDLEKALLPGAPVIHEGSPNNISGEVHKVFGDVDRGFAESDHVFEATYRTTAVPHCCMETRGALAEIDLQGRLTLWTTTQFPHVLKEIMISTLAMPGKNIRILKASMGGGFGARQSMDAIDPIAVHLARKSGHPVRIIKSRQEEFISGRLRYPMIITAKTGVSREGKLLAKQVNIITDGGAYNDQGLAVTTSAGSKITGIYRVANIRIDGKVVFTNKVWGGAFRGYGNPQVTFALETQMDEIAKTLGMDPLELRLKNANQPGDVSVAGAKFVSCGFEECLRKSTQASNWKQKRNHKAAGDGARKRGIGMAACIHTGGGGVSAHAGNFSSAVIKVEGDGSVDLMTGVPDIGQGSDTVLAQIAAEQLGVNLDDMRVHSADTALTPSTQGVRGSRETFMAGNAAKLAAAKAKAELLRRASLMLEISQEELDSAEGKIYVKTDPKRCITVAEAASKPMFERASSFPMGVPIVAAAVYTDPVSQLSDKTTGYGNICPTWTWAVQVVEVEVDKETGQVIVLKVVAANDVGKAINPMAVEGQIEGSVVQGMGMALTEQLIWDKDRGVVLNPNFADDKLPTTMDTPEIQTILVETNDPLGPFGAKGIGEIALVATPAAIANAIYDAIGVHIKELPITPEKVLIALREKGK